MNGMLSAHFPYTTQYTYLNTPAYGLLSEELMEWRQEHDLDHLIGGSRFKERCDTGLDNVRSTVAAFCGTVPEQVYLVPNFSYGWKVLCGGLDKKASVLLLDGDYPSLNWPVMTSGFDSLRSVKTSATMEGDILKAFESSVPDVFVFSITQYLDGLQLAPEFIRALKERYPDTLLVADGTQFLGTGHFDFKNSGIDVLGASGYKWMLAGTGNGFFLVNKVVEERFYPDSLRYEPQKEPFLEGKTHLQYHLEPGHLDSMSMGSLQFSLMSMLEAGMDNIVHTISVLKDYAAELLVEGGFLGASVLDREKHAPFYAIECNRKQLSALEARGIVYAVRGGRLRVGFHIYNRKEEAEQLVKILRYASGD